MMINPQWRALRAPWKWWNDNKLFQLLPLSISLNFNILISFFCRKQQIDTSSEISLNEHKCGINISLPVTILLWLNEANNNNYSRIIFSAWNTCNTIHSVCLCVSMSLAAFLRGWLDSLIIGISRFGSSLEFADSLQPCSSCYCNSQLWICMRLLLTFIFSPLSLPLPTWLNN